MIDPRRASHASLPFTAGFAALQPLLEQALHSEKASMNLDLAAAGVAAQGIALAAELLAQKYHLVITNVPYLARGKQGYTLYKYCETQYSYAKADLATVFVKRCLDLCFAGGCATLVTPQNWLFLGSYKKLRIRLLKSSTLNFVVRLGPAAFQDMNWWAANTALFIITNVKPTAGHYFGGLDVSSTRITFEKPGLLVSNFCSTVSQVDQIRNPDARILSEETKLKGLLSKYADSLQGISTADYPRFVRFYWERHSLTDDWRFLQGSIEQAEFYGGRQQMIWMKSLLENSEELGAAIRGRAAWGKLYVKHTKLPGRNYPVSGNG